MKVKRNKYRAKKIVINGHAFASKAEGRRYQELLLLEKAGGITGLELQPSFKISKGGAVDPTTGRKMPAARYTADFRYVESSIIVIEEVKSKATSRETSYRLRRKLFLEQYGELFDFVETIY